MLDVSEFDVNADEALQLEGKIDMAIGTQTNIRVNILKGSLLSDRLLAILPSVRMNGVTLDVSGPISFQGELNGGITQDIWDFHTDLNAVLKGNVISYMKDQTGFEGKFSGNISVSGKLPELSLSADLMSEQARMEFGKRNLYMKHIRIEFTKGEMDIKGTSLLLPDIHFESSLLRNIHAILALEQGQLALELQGKDVGIIESAYGFGLVPSEWKFDGLSDLRLNATQNEDNGWTFNSQINLHHLAFENTNNGYFGEAISLLLETNGELEPKGSTVVFQTVLNANEGELLMDRFYSDLSSNGLYSFLKGTYEIQRKKIQISSQQIQLKGILDLDLEGTLLLGVGNPYVDLSVKMPKTSLKPLFHHFVQEPFQTEKPLIASIDLSGHVAADLNFTGSISEWMIKGHGWWKEGRLAAEDLALEFAGIDLDLPIWLQTRDDSGNRSEPVRGTLRIQDLGVPMIDNQPLEFSLKMDSNRLWVEEPTVLMVQGGVAKIGPILCENLMSTKRSIKTNLRLDNIDANPFFSQLLPIPVHGTIDGELETVHFAENSLHSTGQIRAQVFEGEVHISNPGISGVFSSFPLYKANISMNDLNLYQMTKGTSFGEIEGILRGHIHDLEITNGQPQKFELLLETVKTKGVDQDISVRAVDNIARIGGGSSPFLGLAGALAGVIKSFPYSKIGIRSSLLNDAFRINGTIKENGQEYLVKRGSFSGVNVVNRNPNTWISFKDMVKRIGRIITSETDPEID
jgi:hypothetical protein